MLILKYAILGRTGSKISVACLGWNPRAPEWNLLFPFIAPPDHA